MYLDIYQNYVELVHSSILSALSSPHWNLSEICVTLRCLFPVLDFLEPASGCLSIPCLTAREFGFVTCFLIQAVVVKQTERSTEPLVARELSSSVKVTAWDWGLREMTALGAELAAQWEAAVASHPSHRVQWVEGPWLVLDTPGCSASGRSLVLMPWRNNWRVADPLSSRCYMMGVSL